MKTLTVFLVLLMVGTVAFGQSTVVLQDGSNDYNSEFVYQNTGTSGVYLTHFLGLSSPLPGDGSDPSNLASFSAAPGGYTVMPGDTLVFEFDGGNGSEVGPAYGYTVAGGEITSVYDNFSSSPATGATMVNLPGLTYFDLNFQGADIYQFNLIGETVPFYGQPYDPSQPYMTGQATPPPDTTGWVGPLSLFSGAFDIVLILAVSVCGFFIFRKKAQRI